MSGTGKLMTAGLGAIALTVVAWVLLSSGPPSASQARGHPHDPTASGVSSATSSPLHDRGEARPTESTPGSGTSAHWQSDLSRYPRSVQEQARSLNTRLFGALAYESPQQAEWLRTNGYPTLDDIAELRFLDDAELEKRVDHGDAKAAFFLLMRYAERAEGIVDPSTGTAPAELIHKRSVLTIELMKSPPPSPFVGYLTADWYTTGEPRPHVAMAGLAYAAMLGDRRALGALSEYDRLYPDVPPGVMLTYLQGMLRFGPVFAERPPIPD